ncbi:HTH-type transcriptional repressor glcR, partial [Dysosmobacter welbionis]
EIRGVEVRELVDVKNGGGLGDTGDIEGLHQLAEGEDLLLAALALGGPAQQSHIVQNGLRQIALGLQVLVGGVPVALGHLAVLVPHNGGAVDVGGDVPAEGLVQQIVLGGGAEVLAAPYHVGDAHQVVVHHIGEVVGGQAVPLQQHLVVQGLVLHGDVAEGHVVEGGGALVGDPLADHIGLAGLHTLSGLLRGQIPAGIVGAVKVTGVLLGCGLLAEAVVGGALFHQQVGVGLIQVPALRLDIGAHGAAYVGALVMGQ